MNILVMCEDYCAPGNPYRMSYVHTRNVAYLRQSDVRLSVLNFRANRNYTVDSVEVITEEEAAARYSSFNIIVSHAPNLKNHCRFLLRHRSRPVVFFIHGHEVLRADEYPPPYDFIRKRKSLVRAAARAYELVKFRVLRHLIHSIYEHRSRLVFVSGWMRDRYARNLNVLPEPPLSVEIPNSVWEDMIGRHHRPAEGAGRKFVTLRRYLDESKYAVDLVVELAARNPGYEFHIYGMGEFFRQNTRPSNVIHHPRVVEQKDLAALLDQYAAAIMPTRFDSQGVMVCEMAAYGIPVLTSDIPVAREMVGDYPNVLLCSNERFAEFDGLERLLRSSVSAQDLGSLKYRFDSGELARRELAVFRSLMEVEERVHPRNEQHVS